MTARPAAVEPAPPKRTPSSLTSISAPMLSLCWRTAPTTSARGGESIDATTVAPAGARPTPVPPTVTPRARRRPASTSAARLAGERA